MDLYTVVAEYAGGTYVRQVEADQYLDVPARWASALSDGEIKGIGPARRAAFVANLDYYELRPVPINGTEGVYCLCDLMAGHLLTLTFVRTQRDASR